MVARHFRQPLPQPVCINLLITTSEGAAGLPELGAQTLEFRALAPRDGLLFGEGESAAGLGAFGAEASDFSGLGGEGCGKGVDVEV